MNGSGGGRKWSRRILLVLAVIGVCIALPFVTVRSGISLLMHFDGRHASAEDALAAQTVFPHGGFKTLNPEQHGYEIRQRQVMKYPAGMLYALGWRDGAGKACLANAFVEKIRDVFGGWKGRGAWGHCGAKNYTAWVTGFGEYEGFAVANGFSGAAALVKVTWRTGDITYARPINGSFLSVLDRHGASANLVEFLDAAGETLESIQPYG